MAVAKPDLLSLKLEAEMLKQVGASLLRVKKRLLDTDLAFQLKPPDTDTREIREWETKISSLINYSEKLPFPKLLDFKRQFAKKSQDRAKVEAENRQAYDARQHERLRLGQQAGARMEQFRANKSFGTLSTHFGGPISGEALKTIENYTGQNTFYGSVETSRTLIRKDGRYTKYEQSSDMPPWVGAGCYANSDPSLFKDLPVGVYTLSFKGDGRTPPPKSTNVRENKISRRNMLDSWRFRDPGPNYARTPESQSLEWRTSRQKLLTEELDAELGVLGPPSTHKIILGDITRQAMLVGLENSMRSKAPSVRGQQSKISDPPSAASSPTRLVSPASISNSVPVSLPTAAALRLQQQTKYRYSYLHTSQHLSAKLARAQHPSLITEQPSGWTGRKNQDYTYGGLDNARCWRGGQEEEEEDSESSSVVSTELLMRSGAPSWTANSSTGKKPSTGGLEGTPVTLEEISLHAPSIHALIRSPKPSLTRPVDLGVDDCGSVLSGPLKASSGRGQGKVQERKTSMAGTSKSAVPKAVATGTTDKPTAGAAGALTIDTTREIWVGPPDTTGIAALPLTSPLRPLIADHLNKYKVRPKSQLGSNGNAGGKRVPFSVSIHRPIGTTPEISIRGLLIEETESSDYIPPNVSTSERESILDFYKDVGRSGKGHGDSYDKDFAGSVSSEPRLRATLED